MIPITESLNLSCDETGRLVQKLLDLKSKHNGIEFDDRTEECLDEFVKSKDKLVKAIDDFMHYDDTFISENIETVTAIVEMCPKVLASEGGEGWLPIHCACGSEEFVPLLADFGIQHEIGGKETRGGLLVALNDSVGNNILEHNVIRAGNSDQLMAALMSKNLFFVEDIKEYNLLHHAVQAKNIEHVRYFTELDPNAVTYVWNEKLPMHYHLHSYRYKRHNQKSLDIFKHILQCGKSQSIYSYEDYIGHMFDKVHNEDENEDSPLLERDEDSDKPFLQALFQDAKKKIKTDQVWDMLEKTFSCDNEFHKLEFLHQIIRHCPEQCSEMFSRFPDSILHRDENNRIPVHVALESGMKWSMELGVMIGASASQLKDVDPLSKLPPFALAASNCDLKTIYTLLQKNPGHVELSGVCKEGFVSAATLRKRAISSRADGLGKRKIDDR